MIHDNRVPVAIITIARASLPWLQYCYHGYILLP